MMDSAELCIRHALKVGTVSLEDAHDAADAWGFNCGPAALCAVCNLTPDQVRPHLGDFESKRYSNPTLMANALRSLRVPFQRVFETAVKPDGGDPVYPYIGLVRVQWGGPWTNPGVPIRVRYRKTHWIAVAHLGRNRVVFDVNAIESGGWISWNDWVKYLIPWILRHCVTDANGDWWPTHCWETISVGI